MSWTVPGDPLYSATAPSAPTGARTRFGTVCPAVKFRFEARGRGEPEAYPVMNPPAVGAVTVTFSTTADTPVAGTPPCPVTLTATVAPARTAAAGAPVPDRVSSTRSGATDPNPPGATGAPATGVFVTAAATGSTAAGAMTAPTTASAKTAISTRIKAFTSDPPGSRGVGPARPVVAGRTGARQHQPVDPARRRTTRGKSPRGTRRTAVRRAAVHR